MESTQISQEFGKYKIIKLLGSGGYADVFLAEDTKLGRRVALKILKQRWMEPTFVENFAREAKSVAAFRHPNIITVYEQEEYSNRVYISMDYIADGSLEERIKQDGALSAERVADFVSQIASALDYAHDQKMIHQDVKPSNILIRFQEGQERLILADFGIAKVLQETSARYSATAIGTTPYMSPEQIERPEDVGHRADVYGLGIVAYQMLTGELPFKTEGKSFIESAREIAESAPPSLTTRGIHPRIERAVFRALEKHPDDRYDSAGAFAGVLDEAVRSWREETGEREAVATLGGLAAQAMDEARWAQAAKYWRRYLGLSPGSALATSQLEIAEREEKLEQLRAAVKQCEASENWDGAIKALEELLNITPEDEQAQKQLSNAQKQKRIRDLYTRATDALNSGDADTTIILTRDIIDNMPGHREATDLLNMATVKKVEKLKDTALMVVYTDAQQALQLVDQIRSADPEYKICPRPTIDEIVRLVNARKVDSLKGEALLAIGRNDAQQALRLVGQIRSADPECRFCSREEIDEIERSATGILKSAERERQATEKARKWRLYMLGVGGIIIAVVIIAALVSFLPRIADGFARATSTPTLTLVPTATFTPVPTSTPMPSPTATPTQTPVPTVTPVPTPLSAAVVLNNGAELRPGATTWWRVRYTLVPETELELIGYDPNFPDWVYVRTIDESAEGWTQVENLQINRALDNLPRITPIPTLIPTPGTDQPGAMPPQGCESGPLWFDAWDVGKICTASGWRATIFVEGHGGNCMYTYSWQGEVKGGPMSGSMTFDVDSVGYGTAIAGQVSVTSAGQTIFLGLHIMAPDCGG